MPRFAARRRIPAQARGLKKYRCGTAPVSKVSDNEHTAASLGHSEVLSVKDSVGPPVPEFLQRREEGAKGPPPVRRQDSGDVFPDNPPGTESANHSEIDEGQLTTRISQSSSESGDGEALAGRSSNDNVN